jgi:hypothetical protein
MQLDSPIQKRNIQWVVISSLFVALMSIFLYFYIAEPFPNGGSDIATSSLTVLAAVAAAWVATYVWRFYGKGSPPRSVWGFFMLALWGWAIAEVIWMVEYIVGGEELARFSIADAFWVVSYFFFLASLFRQYVLIYRPPRLTQFSYLALVSVAGLLFSYLYGLWLLHANPQADWRETYVNAFYAVADIALALGALLLAFTFRSGALGRPWLGLVVFTVADLLYSWLEASGLYAWSIASGNVLTTVTDSVYFAAYLVIAIGCYSQWVLLTYGPRLNHVV